MLTCVVLQELSRLVIETREDSGTPHVETGRAWVVRRKGPDMSSPRRANAKRAVLPRVEGLEARRVATKLRAITLAAVLPWSMACGQEYVGDGQTARLVRYNPVPPTSKRST